MGDIYTNPPQSRNEAILRATIDGTEYTAPPQSRIEDLLLELKEAIEEGGGSVESYEQLTNKPQINGTTLSGNKTTEDLIPIGDGLQINADGELETADAYIPTSEKGTASGVATLTEAGKVPEAQLPSYVDDAIEGYLYEGHFYADSAHTEEITGERGKIYVDLDTNRAYRWTGSTFVEIGDNNTFTANRALVSDSNGKVSASSATSEEVGYLSGVTGAIQTQINGKQNSLTFDTTPTAQSTNPVTSGGIKSYVDGQGAKTVSGNPITITDAEGMNADHVVATITPTQTGSGTPSPSNVRPFTGFSSVDINRYNKNICEPARYTSISDDGITFTDVGADLNITQTIKLPAGTYTASILLKSKPNTSRSLAFSTARYGGTQLAGFSNIQNLNIDQQYSVTFSVEEYTEVIGWLYGSNGGTFKMQMMIEANDRATTYEPYQGQVYTVQLGDTYYGATLDVTSGKLTCEWLKHSLTSNDVDLMALQTASGYRALDCSLADLGLPSVEQSASTQHSKFDCFENVDSGAGQLFGTASIYWNGMVYFWDNGSTYANKSAFQQGLKDIISNTGISFIYKLATPIEIQLTPTQISLLENNNTITTNVSSLDITYQTNNGIGDTASALDKRVTSLESKVPQPPTTDGTYKLTVTVASGEPTYSWESAT